MFTEQSLVDHIHSVTGYVTHLTDEKNIKQINLNFVTEPIIYVGHLGLELFDKTEMFSNGYNEVVVPRYLITLIQMILPRSDFITVIGNVSNAIKLFAPYANDPCETRLTFMKGKVLTTTAGSMWYEEHYGLQTPRIS